MALDDDLRDNDFDFGGKILPWIGGIAVAVGFGYGIYKAGEFLYDKLGDFLYQVNDYLNGFGF